MSRQSRFFLNLFIFFIFESMICLAHGKTIVYSVSQINHLSANSSPPFFIQIGAYTSRAQARSIAHHLPHRYPVNIQMHNELYAVLIGPIPSLEGLRNWKGEPAPIKTRAMVVAPPPYEEWAQFPTPAKTHEVYQEKEVSTYQEPADPTPYKTGSVFALSIGPAWTKSQHETQFFSFASDMQRTFIASNNQNSLTAAEFFFGWQNPYGITISQLGLAVYVAGPIQLNGNVTDSADLGFQNYTYHYKVMHGHLAIKEKLLAATEYYVQPYISGSMGISINHADDFTFSPELYQDVAIPPFSNNSNISYAYTVGLGIQKTFNSHWSVGAGYEFADWGVSTLGPSALNPTGSGLQLNNLYTQQLQFNISYVG